MSVFYDGRKPVLIKFAFYLAIEESSEESKDKGEDESSSDSSSDQNPLGDVGGA